jgi:hypothetical protein
MLAYGYLARCAALLLAAALAGCVTPIPVHDQAISPTYAGQGTLLLAVIDTRDSVLKEGKPPTYLGRAHISFGIPTNMNVYPWISENSAKKGQTLAQALEERIVIGMNERGWKVVGANLGSAPAPEQVPQLLRERGADRLLLLRLTEWSVDVNLNWVGSFDFDWGTAVTVFGSQATPLLSFEDTGKDVVELQSSQSPGNSVRLAFKARLTKLFERPDLQAALTAPVGPSQAHE